MCVYVFYDTAACSYLQRQVYISEFMEYYRRTFPNATITIKLHMLEEHMIHYLQRWKGVGFGLMGEQGAEGIHADFNNLKRRFSGKPDSVERLRCTMNEHHLRCSPQNIATKRSKREE